MALHFRLQAVLHLRQSLEHQQELRLRAANQQVARVRHLIDQMEAHRQQALQRQSEALLVGVTAAELRFGVLCDTELLRHRRELEHQLKKLLQARDQQMEVFRQARRLRETLESVRDLQLRSYGKEAARREQRAMDDLFLMRRDYVRRG